MALEILTRAQIIEQLVEAIKARDTALETGYGPIRDIVVDPVSLVLRQLYLQVERAYDNEFLTNAEIMTTEELDLLGESLSIVRRGPQKAVGSVFFYTSSQPSADIIIPAGFPVSTKSTGFGATERVAFVTTRSVTLYAASASAYFNPVTGVFEIEAPIEAITPGKKSLVAPGVIANMQRQVSGLANVINKSSTTGGRDSETNTEYARRIRLALLGTDRGTVKGVQRTVLTDDRVIDALVVMSGDPLMRRTEDQAGAVDVYVVGSESAIDQQIIIYDSFDIFFEKEPLIFPGPVSSVVGGIVGPLTEGEHFFVVPDSKLNGSKRAQNILRWNRSAAGLPAIGETVTIEFVYDQLIRDLQDMIELPENDVLADILIRQATAVNIVLNIEVRITGDISVLVVESGIRSAIKAFINTRALGEDIVTSDLDVVIRGVPGVDFVVLPFNQLSRAGETGASTVVINKNEYSQITDAAITLTLTQ